MKYMKHMKKSILAIGVIALFISMTFVSSVASVETRVVKNYDRTGISNTAGFKRKFWFSPIIFGAIKVDEEAIIGNIIDLGNRKFLYRNIVLTGEAEPLCCDESFHIGHYFVPITDFIKFQGKVRLTVGFWHGGRLNLQKGQDVVFNDDRGRCFLVRIEQL
jgi:hypothetical protein